MNEASDSLERSERLRRRRSRRERRRNRSHDARHLRSPPHRDRNIPIRQSHLRETTRDHPRGRPGGGFGGGGASGAGPRLDASPLVPVVPPRAARISSLVSVVPPRAARISSLSVATSASLVFCPSPTPPSNATVTTCSPLRNACCTVRSLASSRILVRVPGPSSRGTSSRRRTVYFSRTSRSTMLRCRSKATTFARASPRTPDACRVTTTTRTPRSCARTRSERGPPRALASSSIRASVGWRVFARSDASLNFAARSLASACAATEASSRRRRLALGPRDGDRPPGGTGGTFGRCPAGGRRAVWSAAVVDVARGGGRSAGT